MTMSDPRAATPPGALADLVGHRTFSREEWSAPGRGDAADGLGPTGEPTVDTGSSIPPEEIEEVYRPLVRLIGVLRASRDAASRSLDALFATTGGAGPYLIGVTGSVAVGKSTTAGLLQALLHAGADRPAVEVLTTDGFLYPNQVLAERGLLDRKGFPESYDGAGLIAALRAIRDGADEVRIPVYSHANYDIVPGEAQLIHRPDIVIVEGLNVLQPDGYLAAPQRALASDFLDTSLYVDAAEEDLFRWFYDRLFALRAMATPESGAFLHWFSSLSEEEADAVATQVWSEINLVNLREHVAPSRARAQIVLHLDGRHRTTHVSVRHP
jgi:type I pantothenate kinase